MNTHTLKTGLDSKKDSKNMASGGFSGAGLSGAVSASANFVKPMQDRLFNNMKDDMSDDRYNPEKSLKKNDRIGFFQDVNTGGTEGAKAGAAFGPFGIVIGTGVGQMLSIGERLFTKGERERERERKLNDWSLNWASKTASGLDKMNYSEGGLIVGEGTAKSDSINANVKDGSFIVPAENAEYAMDLGKNYLGWDDDTIAKRNDGTINKNLSNGEVLFNPQEVSVLRYHGINVEALAPNAQQGVNRANGGPNEEDPNNKKDNNNSDSEDWKYDSQRNIIFSPSQKLAYDKSGQEYTVDEKGQYHATGTTSAFGSSLYSEYGKEKGSRLTEFAPELIAAIQAAGGAAGLIQAGKRPNLQISQSLNRLSSEVRRAAEYGYDKSVLNDLNNSVDRARIDLSRVVAESGGSSGLESMSKLNSLLSTTLDKKASIAYADAAEKSRKFENVMKVESAKADEEYDISKTKLASWNKDQEAYGNLLSSGISNFIGAIKLKKEEDTLKDIGSNNPWKK